MNETSSSQTNWARNVTYSSGTVERPSHLDQVQELVAEAPRVRALGSRHSFNTIADTRGTHIDVAGLPDCFELDTRSRTVTVLAGTRYGEVARRLDAAGWALHNLASLPHISVGGAIATGTHGSGDANGSLSTAVAGLQFVGADGRLHALRRGDRDFDACVVSLGLLGVTTHVTLDVQPTFQVSQSVFEHLPWTDVAAHFDEIMSAAYSVSLFTVWGSDVTAWLKSDGPTRSDLFAGSPATSELHPLPDLDAGATTRQLGVAGAWHERLPHFQLAFTPSNGDELQTEYLVPRHAALEAFEAVRHLASLIQPLLLISEIRSVAADSLWLSPSHSNDCIALHFTWRPDVTGVAALLPQLDDVLAPLTGRPHWGKLFTTTCERLSAAYPRLTDFRELADRFDPTHKFSNALTDGWLGRHPHGTP